MRSRLACRQAPPLHWSPHPIKPQNLNLTKKSTPRQSSTIAHSANVQSEMERAVSLARNTGIDVLVPLCFIYLLFYNEKIHISSPPEALSERIYR